MRTGNSYIRRGQFTLIMGIFILILIIILTLSIYMLYHYLKNNTLSRISRIKDITNYEIIPINITIQNNTIISVIGSTDKILTGVAYCINASKSRKIVKIGKVEIQQNKLITSCIANDSLNITLEYNNLKKQRAQIYLNISYYEPLLQIEGTNTTLHANLTFLIYATYEGIPFYTQAFVQDLWNLKKIYNTDYVFIRDVPVYNYSVSRYEIMYMSEKLMNYYNGSSRSYYFINETVKNILNGSGTCVGLENYSIIRVYPYSVKSGRDLLSNCTVNRVLFININITKTYLNNEVTRRLNITLARLLSFNQIVSYYAYSHTGLSLVDCAEVGTNEYECVIEPFLLLFTEYDTIVMEFQLNSTNLYESLLSLVKGFCNSSIVLMLDYLEFKEYSYANLIAYLYLVNSLGESTSIELANATVTCDLYATPPCQVTMNFYNYTADISSILTSQTTAYLVLVYTYYNIDLSIVVLDFRNMTLIPLK